jgi:D-alanyl-D-alanine carboxypeptidase/D-alanyl-D-alanine-endopeptidase (penicillin-binding protein 4)
MRIIKRLQAACILLALSCTVLAQGLPAPVDDVLKSLDIPRYAVGVYVQEAGGGPVLAEANADSPLSPASTMKLLTSYAALELLGPAFKWKTQAFAHGRQAGDILYGDLIIKGSGDPKFVAESLWQFLRRIRGRGIREIQGNLVLDRSAFETAPHDAASFDGDPAKPYNAGPDALLFNFKAMSFRFVPDTPAGMVHLAVDPPVAGYPVVPPVLSDGECGNWRNRLLPVIDAGGARFQGVYPAACGERVWHLHAYQMTSDQYFSAAFRRIWTDLGGTFTGDVRSGTLPQDARLVAQWDSAPVAEVIRDVNKFSNNVMARQLLLTIAHQVLQIPATAERGAAAISLWLANKGIAARDMRIENGSGLSRSERMSALTMGQLLVAAFRSPTMPEFIASMPLIGLDGTMRERLRAQTVAGNGHIKTGSLNDVRSVAGYVLAASGKRYVVVFMINHARAVEAQAAQDALLQWVYENG